LLTAVGSGASPQLADYFHSVALNVAQRELLIAVCAQPEMFNAFAGGVKTKNFSAIHAHQRLRALRIGTF
jgi:hypothetical protein